MDLATLIGLVGAILVVLVAVNVGGSAIIFVNVPSILIVFVGTFLVVMVKFSLADFLGALRVASQAFSTKMRSSDELIEEIMELAKLARKEGILALEQMEISDSFLKEGVMMMVDGMDQETIKSRLNKDLQQTISRHTWGAKVFTATADVAPALGMIGTLIGLVQMLSNMEDPETIGPAMAVALLTTLYGAILANVVAKPIADKLTMRKMEEGRNKSLCLDGILAIHEGLNPRLIEPLLKLYIAPKKRYSETPEPEKEESA